MLLQIGGVVVDESATEDRDASRRRTRLEGYDRLRLDRPKLFINPPDAPIEILFRREDQYAVANAAAVDYAARGIPSEHADIGIVYEDRFIRVVRDAVKFSGGDTGPYVRILTASGAAGCAVLPVTISGDVVILSHFRHDSRRWHLEIPRGFGDAGEQPETTARRELREEIGLDAIELHPLGPVDMEAGEPDQLFFARVDGTPAIDTREAIGSIRLLAYSDFLALIASGEIADAYTLAAVARAQAMALLA